MTRRRAQTKYHKLQQEPDNYPINNVEDDSSLYYGNPPPYVVKPVKHTTYYFERGNCVIQVEHTLFKVWDVSFQLYSKSFLKRFDNHQYDDNNPLVLSGVNCLDFERLLWVIYPPVIGEYKATTIDDWVAILKLSTMWNFESIRNLAIKQLSLLTIEPVRKIVLEHTYEINRQWAYSAYIALCSKDEPVTVPEATQLGAETTAMISLAREKLGGWWGRNSPTAVKRVVEEVFGLKEQK